MSSGKFKGKESSNRIELSRLVQELLKFGVFGLPAALGRLGRWVDEGGGGWGWVDEGGGAWGVSHTCTHTHVHARTRMRGTHMYRFHANGRQHWRHPCLACPYACLTCMCVRACVRVCACMHVHVRACMGHPPHTHANPHPHPPIRLPPPGGDPRNQFKFNNT